MAFPICLSPGAKWSKYNRFALCSEIEFLQRIKNDPLEQFKKKGILTPMKSYLGHTTKTFYDICRHFNAGKKEF